jgi:hypothetical protein
MNRSLRHVPNLVSIFRYQIVPKNKRQNPKPYVAFVTGWYFTVGVVSLSSNPQAGVPPPVIRPQLLIKFVRSYSSYMEVVSSIRNPGTRHAVVTGTHIIWPKYEYIQKYW